MNLLKTLIASASLVMAGFVGFAQTLVINEVVAKNAESYVNKNEKTPDWIELKNVSSAAIDLSEYSLATTKTLNSPIPLPAKTLQSNGYFLYEATSNTNNVMQWATVVDYGTEFSYIVPQENMSGWISSSFNDSGWQKGNSPIGYGEPDIVTNTDKVISVFLRKHFSASHIDEISQLFLHMDCDDGFIAYLNGVEVARSNMNSANFDAFATTYADGVIRFGEIPPAYDITNAIKYLNDGDNVLCIQFHNCSESSSDLIAIPLLTIGYSSYVADVPAISSYLSLPSGKSFSLDASSETVYLLKGTKIIDSIAWKNLPVDVSIGRARNDISEICYFEKTTPGTANNAESFTAKTLDKPKFEIPAGVYQKKFMLHVYSSDTKAELHYTTDGSIPTKESPRLTEAIEIRKNTNLRVRAFRVGYLPSEVATASYIFSVKRKLPIASITVVHEDFWDYNTGIYATGPNASKDEPYFGANFWQDWEKPVHLDYFDESGACVVSQDLGCKIGGNWSRAHPQKTLKLYARDKYGKSEIEYQFFKDKPISSFHMIMLRNSGNDFNNTQMRDGMISELAKNMDIDREAYQPAIVYINGEYYGIQNVREKQNKHYVAENYGYDKSDIDVMKNGYELTDGFADDYWEMRNFIENNDMSLSANYEKAKKLLDIPSYIDYYILETYIVNGDWPGNNYACWHSRSDDTPWRYLLFDCDFGFGIWDLEQKLIGFWNEEEKRIQTMFEWCLSDNSSNYAHDTETTAMLRSLMKNPEFRRDYMNVTADRLNTTFSPANVTKVIDSVYALISSEMPKHIDRWGYDWQDENLSKMREFGERRGAIMRQQTEDFFATNGSYNLTLNVSENGAGKIHLNTIDVKEFPWSGQYFKNNTIFLTAIPNPGFEFSHWEGAVESADETISVTSSEAINVTAVFNYVGNEPELQFTELYYHTFSEGETRWVELQNTGGSAVDLSGYKICVDRYNQQFEIPNDVTVDAGEYIVFANTAQSLQMRYPDIHVVGDMGIDFPKDFATITLKNPNGITVANMSYSESASHARKADGYGFTYELIGDEWYAPSFGGTPGAENDEEPVRPTCECNLVINEINYASSEYADAGDWIELYNPRETATINLQNFMIRDKSGHVSVIYDKILVEPGEYVVLVDNVQKFKTIHPNVECHQVDLSLNKFIDAIYLYDPYEFLEDEMSYSMFDPNMTTMAFETGKTLALTTPDVDNSNPANWKTEQRYGSPGAANQTAVSEIQPDAVEIYSYGRTIYIKQAEPNDIKIYDNLGQLVAHVNSCRQEEQFSIGKNGVYLVSIGSTARVVILK